VYLANPSKNADEIIRLVKVAVNNGADVIVFPKDCITGATCGDLHSQHDLCEAAALAKNKIQDITKDFGIDIILGESCFYYGINIVADASPDHVNFRRDIEGKLYGLGNAVYVNAGHGESTTDHVYNGLKLIYENGKLTAESKPYLLQSDIIYHEFNSNINRNPYFIETKQLDTAFDIVTMGLIRRFEATNAKRLILALSGGLDSTHALLVCLNAVKRMNKTADFVLCVNMPGYGTSGRTHGNARKLAVLTGALFREISIVEACDLHMRMIGHDPTNANVTFENIQARERMQIVMDIANAENGFVVGTGDMTELALGFTTYNGDHMGGYNVNANIPKTMVQALVSHIADRDYEGTDIHSVLHDVVSTPISPELLPLDENGEIKQLTEEIVGSYVVNDFFLYYVLKHGCGKEMLLSMAELAFPEHIKILPMLYDNFIRRFITQQYKRSCMPDGAAVFDFGLSPRSGYKMPSDAEYGTFL
jgi:NAD+ synthase (glutamine-hydrolysing)